MDAARAALQRDDAWNWRVPKPRILSPLFPTSLLSPRAMDVDRRIVGPENPVPWPATAAWLDYDPMVAAVIGDEGSRLNAGDVREHVFGYTLVSDWRARSGDGSPVESADGVPIAIGPCVVTADELGDPQAMYVHVKVDDQELLKGNLNGTTAVAVRADRLGVDRTPCWNEGTPSRWGRSRVRTTTPNPRAVCGRAPWSNSPPRASGPSATASPLAESGPAPTQPRPTKEASCLWTPTGSTACSRCRSRWARRSPARSWSTSWS